MKMAQRPTLQELVETVARMSARFSASGDPRVVDLMHYVSMLERRFEADLPDPRDQALAHASALMVVRAVAEQWQLE
ncbi:hypothetical protein FE840_008500 [Peteryoungia desertarenae]|uniref:Uncharacterized protein n=1 Tax=Peteryoungia desertarenae TaxID=1813451 RepID=A0ABX6QM84_9HYPH|nr:hypothetical protein [Peteryoungia desertarenae]QLF69579.1 hypothetical protein FE840_008500 [Peteryoungia desertarenae]